MTEEAKRLTATEAKERMEKAFADMPPIQVFDEAALRSVFEIINKYYKFTRS